MRSGTIAFLVGILCLQIFSGLPSLTWVGLLLLSIPAALLLPAPWRLAGWLLSGFLWSLWSAHHILQTSLPVDLEGQDVMLEGYIAGLPETGPRRVRFLFDVETLERNGDIQRWPARVRLNWYGTSLPLDLRVGDKWRFQVRLKQPRGFMNPGGFDYERWLFAQRIRATGYVRYQAERLRQADNSWRYAIDRGRQWLSRHQAAGRSEANVGSLALIQALTVGDRRSIEQSTWHILRTTGTAHLLAISGMHIGLLAGLVYWLSLRLWRYLGGRLLLRLPAPRAAALAASLAALLYAALAGFSVPTQRALIMLLVAMLAVWRLRPLQPGRTLAWGLLLVLLLDPLAVLSAGFWLSFVAVGLILYAVTGQLGRQSRPVQWLRVQGWITLGLLPLMLLIFQQVSLVSPLANLLAIPLVSLLVVPLALLATVVGLTSPELAQWLFSLVATLLEWLLQLLEIMADWPLAYLNLGFPDWSSLLLLMPGILLLLAPRGMPGRSLAPLLMLPMLFGQFSRPLAGQAWLTLLDVGQGLAAVIETRSHLLVFDTGPRFSTGFDTGKAVVVPYLQQAGHRRIDVLVISHGDNDHIGGLESVLARYPVSRIYTSVPEQVLAEQVVHCHAGQRWQWDGVRFEFLGPAGPASSENDGSCVLRIAAGGQVALLTADIEQAGEQMLLDQAADKLSAQLLVVPHHGSLTSSTPSFVDAVRPEYVLYPVGYRNRYRFPRPAVVRRYAGIGADQYLSHEQGAMRFVLGEEGGPLKQFSYRQAARRYWHSGT